ncbi:MAG: hypothetical protein LC802_18425, partial [Acidobacteria bacterium]|nr:hypothetical protein [Acidobacteriota bacterium]
MLFIQSNSLALSLDEGGRLRLTDALASRELAPLIRTTRRRAFELLAGGRVDDAFVETAAAEMERRFIARRASEGGDAYTPGEIFCAGDCVLFLSFDAGAEGVSTGAEAVSVGAEDVSVGAEMLCAGVVYSVETAEPLAKLERFCRDVRAALAKPGEDEGGTAGEASPGFPEWKTRANASPRGLA